MATPNEHAHNPEHSPGRAAFQEIVDTLQSEPYQQCTSRNIEAILDVSDGYYVDASCGVTRTQDSQQGTQPKLKEYLGVTIGRHNTPPVSMQELIATEGKALFSAIPPDKRYFGYGKVEDRGLSDDDFREAMSHLSEELPPGTMAWIEQAMATTQAPDYRPGAAAYAHIDQLIDAARVVLDVTVETNELTVMTEMRFVGGWHLSAHWEKFNEGYLKRRRTDWAEAQCKITLNNPFTNERYMYVRDVHGNEAVIAETSDPEKRFTAEFLGYEVHEPQTWLMWHKDIAELGLQQLSDSALGDFARQINEVMNTEKLGAHDLFIHEMDGTVHVRKAANE